MVASFDDIIGNLDNQLQNIGKVLTADPAPVPVRKPPKFQVGDIVVMKATQWPAMSGNVVPRTGVYSLPGFPILTDSEVPVGELEWRKNPRIHERLKENLVGTICIGDTCRVIAQWCSETDCRWYYFFDNGKADGKGWSRCDYRFEKKK